MPDYPLFEFKMVADCAADLQAYVTANEAWNALRRVQQYLRSMAKHECNGRGGNLTSEQLQVVEWIYEDILEIMPKLND